MEIDDVYEHEDPSLLYTVENVLYEANEQEQSSEDYKSLTELYNSILLNNCSCSAVNTNRICSESNHCHHGGNYELFQKGGNNELILNIERKNRDLIYECFQLCTCLPTTCSNRLVQKGPRKDLKIVEIACKGNGLITTKSIPKGAFICEYAGEILTKSEALKRIAINLKDNKMNYIMCLNELSEPCGSREGGQIPSIQTFIDPSVKGNFGRYLNHSCDPNCEILSIRVDNPIPKLGIFAKRYISLNEELCFHYGIGGSEDYCEEEEKKPCFCGTDNCKKFLPSLRF